MDFDKTTVNNFSRMASRGVFGKALEDIEYKYDNLKVVVADVLTSAKLEGFYKKAPHKLINVGIAEQNMVGIAAGLASEGYTVFATTFSPFASMRCFEMLRTQLGYMALNVKVVGLLSGLSGGYFGNTHYGLEDLAITRTIPNMTVLSPADCIETYKATEAAADFNGPVYMRLTGVNGTPAVYKEDYQYEIGKGIVLKEGSGVAIIATGTMVYESLRAARALKKYDIEPTVVNMHTIKPLDTKIIDDLCENHTLIVTVEEHFITGGLGSAVAEYITQKNNRVKQLMLGVSDCFGKAGEYLYMLNQYGLTAPKIVKKIVQSV